MSSSRTNSTSAIARGPLATLSSAITSSQLSTTESTLLVNVTCTRSASNQQQTPLAEATALASLSDAVVEVIKENVDPTEPRSATKRKNLQGLTNPLISPKSVTTSKRTRITPSSQRVSAARSPPPLFEPTATNTNASITAPSTNTSTQTGQLSRTLSSPVRTSSSNSLSIAPIASTNSQFRIQLSNPLGNSFASTISDSPPSPRTSELVCNEALPDWINSCPPTSTDNNSVVDDESLAELLNAHAGLVTQNHALLEGAQTDALTISTLRESLTFAIQWAKEMEREGSVLSAENEALRAALNIDLYLTKPDYHQSQPNSNSNLREIEQKFGSLLQSLRKLSMEHQVFSQREQTARDAYLQQIEHIQKSRSRVAAANAEAQNKLLAMIEAERVVWRHRIERLQPDSSS